MEVHGREQVKETHDDGEGRVGKMEGKPLNNDFTTY